jgi:hypothetical protein
MHRNEFLLVAFIINRVLHDTKRTAILVDLTSLFLGDVFVLHDEQDSSLWNKYLFDEAPVVQRCGDTMWYATLREHCPQSVSKDRKSLLAITTRAIS